MRLADQFAGTQDMILTSDFLNESTWSSSIIHFLLQNTSPSLMLTYPARRLNVRTEGEGEPPNWSEEEEGDDLVVGGVEL